MATDPATAGDRATGGDPTTAGDPAPMPPPTGPGAIEIAWLLGLPTPTDEQVAVIEAPLEPVLVVAGAGSGKTETMAARVLWLVAGGHARPDEILGLTFTRKAAGELAARIRRRLAALRERLGPTDERYVHLLATEPAVSTYHAYAARLVDEHGLRLGIEPASRVIGPAVCWQYADRLVPAYAGEMDRISQQPASVASAVLSLAGELAEHLVTPEHLQAWTEDFCATIEALPRLDGRPGPYSEVKALLAVQLARLQLLPLVEAYDAHKRARSELDFGDQVAIAARLAAEVPEVGATERRRHPVVLLDEYQDTGTAQRMLLSALFGRAARVAGADAGHPVMAVGDPCQSIYGWRGASAGNLTRFPEEFPRWDGRPARRRVLTISWRNGSSVLDLANLLAGPLRAAGVDVEQLRPAAGAPAGQVRCALLATADAEAEWVADTIAAEWTAAEWTTADQTAADQTAADQTAADQTAADQAAADQSGRGRRPTLAVLCRKRTQFGPIADALTARGVPVEVVGLGGLLAEPEVGDVVATLRVLSDPSAGPALARLLTGPRWRIGPRDLVALGDRARRLAQRARRAGQAGAAAEAALDDAGNAAGHAAVKSAGEAGTGSASGVPAEAGALEVGPPPDETDAASLVDALDDLGPPQQYSPDGRARLSRLREELRMLRHRTDQPLPDLVAEIERVTLLEIEVAVHSNFSPAQARANLDRFLDVAAEFDSADDWATVSGFLGYLDAAEAQERGLEPGAVEVAADRVQVLTVHGAKGLEWDVVAVVGLAEGIFPDKKGGDSWTGALGALPVALRGDRADLPTLELAVADQKALDDERKRYRADVRARGLVEEQRLAYVAVTRARRLLLASGFWWAPDTIRAKGPSSLLQSIESWCRATDGGRVEHWEPEPAADTDNPLGEQATSVGWPVDPIGPRRERLAAAAAAVRQALAARTRGTGAETGAEGVEVGAEGDDSGAQGAETGAERVEVGAEGDDSGVDGDDSAADGDDLGADGADSWLAEAELLLAERAAHRPGSDVDVDLPSNLSVSSLVVLRRDPAELARQLRRPVPFKPAPLARRGTAFHAWLEQRFHAQRLLDVDELPGAADEGAAPDADLVSLKQSFLASGWAERRPYDVEVPFEADVGGVLVRGRMDAVFRRDDGPEQGSLFDDPTSAVDAAYDVVDWKTGAEPHGEQARAAAVQLAAYRLAWADLHTGGDLSRVNAAFHYVRTSTTVRPVDLLDRAGLEALIAGLPEVSAGQS